jgi:diguanylate cyclase (GGDEF)-like protein
VHTDPLTGLANRRYFFERLEQALSLAQRHDHPMSLIVCDLDHFKQINDRLGHLTGDRVLEGLGHLLRRECRKEDLPARFGGEEFVVLLPETNARGAGAVAERLRTELACLELRDDGEPVTGSFGIAEHEAGDDDGMLVGRADAALYAAKEMGRNRCFIWDSTRGAAFERTGNKAARGRRG